MEISEYNIFNIPAQVKAGSQLRLLLYKKIHPDIKIL